MRAAQAANYGPIDEVLTVENNTPVPQLKGKKKHLLIQTHAVSLACGDVRVLSGLTREVQGPPQIPYIPAADACGTVVQLPPGRANEIPFHIGDRVALRFAGSNFGAAGEYAVVPTACMAKVPENLSSAQAAALASAAPAQLMAEWYIQRGDRVLIVGAGGGVGSHLCQLAKVVGGASFVAGTGSPETVPTLCLTPLSCDVAVDYTKNDPYDESLPMYDGKPFDVVFDLAGGGWDRLEKGHTKLVKPAGQGGRFITTVPPCGPQFEIHGIGGMFGVFLVPILLRAMKSRIWTRSSLPYYTFSMALDGERTHLERLFKLAEEGKIEAVMDHVSHNSDRKPYAFSTQGLREAFKRQESRHAHGKVIMEIS